MVNLFQSHNIPSYSIGTIGPVGNDRPSNGGSPNQEAPVRKKSKGFSIDSILDKSNPETDQEEKEKCKNDQNEESGGESGSDSVISRGSRDFERRSRVSSDSISREIPNSTRESSQINQTSIETSINSVPTQLPVQPVLPVHVPRAGTLLPNPATGFVNAYNPLLRDNPLFSSVAEGIAIRQRFLQNQLFQRNFDFSRIFNGIYPKST